MPRYDYYCPACDFTVELTHSMADDTARICRSCGYKMIKQMTIPGVQFKGPGFYATDNPKR